MQEPKNEQESKQQEQETLFVEVLVKCADGKPVCDATVTPWALGSAMGHGRWSAKSVGGVEPTPVITDSQGNAKVAYVEESDTGLIVFCFCRITHGKVKLPFTMRNVGMPQV